MIEKFLEGKGALITGAASGFGRQIAIEYAKRGAELVLVDVNQQSLEDTTKKIAQEYSKKVIPIACDVSSSEQVQAMAKQAAKEVENIYVLNNNAGIGLVYGPDLLRIKEDMFDKIMGVNLRGQWLVSKYVCKEMKKQKFENDPLSGKVIHTASISGMVVDEKLSAYSISKAGVIAMVQLLARSLAPKILVNSISPGYHLTGIYKESLDAMVMTMKDGHVKTPLNRIGTVEDVANLSVFLASSASNFITGHNFPCDGGIAEVGVPPNYMETEF